MKEFKGYLKKFWWSYFVFIYVVNSLTSCYHSTMYAIRDNKQNYSYNIQKEEKKEVVHTFEEFKKENKLGSPFFEVENHKIYIIKKDINSIDNTPLKLLYVNTDKESQDMDFGIKGLVTNDYSAIHLNDNSYKDFDLHVADGGKYVYHMLSLTSDKTDYSYRTYFEKEKYEYKTKNISLVWNKGIPEKSEIYLIAKINGRIWELPVITLE